MADYQSPSVTTWGTITDLTQGQGMSNSSDDFVSCPTNEKQDDFVGSNDNEVWKCED